MQILQQGLQVVEEEKMGEEETEEEMEEVEEEHKVEEEEKDRRRERIKMERDRTSFNTQGRQITRLKSPSFSLQITLKYFFSLTFLKSK